MSWRTKTSGNPSFGKATLVIFKSMDKKEFRVLIKYCFLMGKNTAEGKQWLDKRYGDSAPGKSTIINWYAELNAVVETPMTLNALVAQNQQLFRKI